MDKKISSCLVDFGFKVVVEEGGAVEGLSESVEKYFFQIMLNEVLKICEK